MKNKLTHAEKQADYLNKIKIEFCEKLKWSEDEYCELVFENAFTWLEIRGLPDSFTYSSTFWNWWKLSYAKMNEDLLLSGNINSIDFGKFILQGSTYTQIKNESLTGTT